MILWDLGLVFVFNWKRTLVKVNCWLVCVYSFFKDQSCLILVLFIIKFLCLTPFWNLSLWFVLACQLVSSRFIITIIHFKWVKVVIFQSNLIESIFKIIRIFFHKLLIWFKSILNPLLSRKEFPFFRLQPKQLSIDNIFHLQKILGPSIADNSLDPSNIKELSYLRKVLHIGSQRKIVITIIFSSEFSKVSLYVYQMRV